MATKETLKGTYCLLINLKQDPSITVGKLGTVNFKKGEYVYVGSALNSLKPRIKRHLSTEKKLHWHVDYLLTHKDTEIADVIYTVCDDRVECDLARIIAEKGAEIPGFGCSDCKCDSHLFYFQLDDLVGYCLEGFRKLGLNPQKY